MWKDILIGFAKAFINTVLLSIPSLIKDREYKSKDKLIEVLVDAVENGVSQNQPGEASVSGTAKNLVKIGLNRAVDKAEESLNKRARKALERYL